MAEPLDLAASSAHVSDYYYDVYDYVIMNITQYFSVYSSIQSNY